MLLDFDGYQGLGPLTQDYGYVQNCDYSAGNGIGGGYSIRTTALNTGDFGDGIYLGFPSMDRTGVFGTWADCHIADTGTWGIIEVWQGDRFLKVSPNGNNLVVWSVNGLNLTATNAINTTTGVFKRIELKWRVSSLDASNQLSFDGMIELRVGQAIVASASGIQLGFSLPTGQTRDVQWNVVVNNPHGDGGMHYLLDGSGSTNNDFLGDNIAVQLRRPATGNGTYTELTPSTGTDQGAMVDDTTSDGDSTYLQTSLAARKSSFNFADFSSIGTQRIVAVKHTAYGKKTESGFRRFRSFIVRDGADRFASTDHPVGVGYFAWMNHIWETDPHTESGFTLTDLNNSQFGILIG